MRSGRLGGNVELTVSVSMEAINKAHARSRS